MSNPDKDFPHDTDRFTPMEMPVVLIPKYPPEDSLDLLDGEETGVPFGLEQEAYGTPKTWAQQVEAESAAAGHEEKPSSLPWPPLSQEQVVELHEALVAFQEELRTDDTTYRDNPVALNQAHGSAARGLSMVLWSLNIGTPQPPPRQEENLGGFACLDERRMGPPAPLGAYTGPPVEMVPIPAYSGAEPVDVPLTQKAVERTYPCRECGKPRTKAEGGTTFTVCDECWDKVHPMRTSITPTPEVRRNCWTCGHLFQHICPRTATSQEGTVMATEVKVWRFRQGCGAHFGESPQNSDGCPGWTPK